MSNCQRKLFFFIFVILFYVQTHQLNASVNSHGNFNGKNDPHRSAYHFQPLGNWMNDPNGPFIYKGVYHLFYQHYPYAPIWDTQMVWGHSTSMDLINWTHQPIALSPSQPYDINGCFSGSTTVLPGNKPAILYTGSDTVFNQVQNLAFPDNLSDPYLLKWVKADQNPLMIGTKTNGINSTSFRDPTTAWLHADGEWRVAVGTQDGKRGLAVLFTSKDFVTWTKVDRPLHSTEDSGVWECPEFFPVYIGTTSLGAEWSVTGPNVRHVLKVSLYETQYEYYTIGTYDTIKDIYVPDEGSIESDLGLRLDYGKFYASKSFFDDNTGRRIIWSWVNESSTQDDDLKRGWFGLQAIPRTILLDNSGKQLVQWPVNEVEMLRGHRVDLPAQVLAGGSLIPILGITPAQVDVEISFKITNYNNVEELDPKWSNPQILCSENGASVNGGLGPFGLLTLASSGLDEQTAVYFRVFKGPNNFVVLMCSDQSKSSLNPTTDKHTYGAFVDINPIVDELSLRILIDHSIVESFGAKGKSCITARVYPTLAINENANLYVFNNGSDDVMITSLSAWNMKSALINVSQEYEAYNTMHDDDDDDDHRDEL